MQRLVLSLVLGLFSQPGAPPSPSPPSTAQPAAVRAPGPSQAELEAEARALTTPPATGAEVGEARATVEHERDPGPDGGVTHRFRFAGGATVEFADHARRPGQMARRERVVFYTGTESAAKEPGGTFDAAGRASGLAPDAVSALRFMSRHEGGFDAINTWDRARFSWGFIQFAGGYGFPPVLGLLKARQPELFHKLLAAYGVDVLPGPNGRPEPVYTDPASHKLLRGAEAEQAFGDDPLVIALFIRAGRVPEVKQIQVEAAIRDYVSPALNAPYRTVKLASMLRSPQALAMLIDRQVHEGNVIRLQWALENACALGNSRDPAGRPALEGQALDFAVQDADARGKIAVLSEDAASGLERAAAAAGSGLAARVPDGPSLTSARTALETALSEADYRMVVSYRRDDLHRGLVAAMTATEPCVVGAEPAGQMRTQLSAAAGQLRALVAPIKGSYVIRNRLKDIRTSDLPGPASRYALR